jgi:hypothetical protein
MEPCFEAHVRWLPSIYDSNHHVRKKKLSFRHVSCDLTTSEVGRKWWARGSQKWLVLILWTVGKLMKIVH